MRLVPIFILTFLLSISACKPSIQTNTNSFDWHYYLNTYTTLMNDIVEYGSKITGFTEIKYNESGKSDTSYLAGTMVDWDSYVKPFLALNLQEAKYQGVYTMSQMIDTNTKTVDIHYDPLFENLPIRKMIVKLNSQTSALQSVYAEQSIKNAFTKQEQTFLYQSGRLIQIVDTKHNATGAVSRTARQLNFMMNREPTVEISSALDK
jgi:hypothetical protein